jgi:type IV pilus assembly protein PilV
VNALSAKSNPPRRPAASRGFTLIELLVALVVLSVGMLGIAKLFVVTLQGNASATSRLYAVNLATDLADRIRANRTAGIAYAGGGANNNCVGGVIGAVTCTPAQMAANDLLLWQQQVAATWPAGGAAANVLFVAGAPNTPNTYTITINWQEQGTGQQLSYVLNVQI